MNFKEELDSILKQTNGAVAAVLMGFDGIVVAESNKGSAPSSLQDVSVEYSRILKEAIKINQGNDLGELQELTVMSKSHRFVFRIINAEYFVGLILKGDASLGKGRYVLRRAASSIHGGL